MISYEYKVVHNYIDSLEFVLNHYAKDGWKLDQVIFLPHDSTLDNLPFIAPVKHIVYIVLIKEIHHEQV